MATAIPRVRRERKKAASGKYYSRTEQHRGDSHSRTRENERKVTGRFTPYGKGRKAETARKIAQARQQPRDVIGRFVKITDKAAKDLEHEIIWGKSKRTYTKKRGQPSTMTLENHAQRRAKAGVPIKGRKRATTRKTT